MGCFLWQNADKIGNFAQVALVVIAIWGLCFARKQINTGRSTQHEATAKAIYSAFLKLAFNQKDYDNGPNGEGDKRYERFVGILLNACDELASGMPRQEMWEKVIRAELSSHSSYLGSQKFRDVGGWDLYSGALKTIGQRV